MVEEIDEFEEGLEDVGNEVWRRWNSLKQMEQKDSLD